MKIAGIDPSINSSGKVIMDIDDDTMDIRGIRYYGYTMTRYLACDTPEVYIEYIGKEYAKFSMPERMHRAYEILDKDMDDVKYIGIEDYAYGKAGKVGSNRIFQIGEFCGGVRYHFYEKGIGIVNYNIRQIKKYATGDGNADKIPMCVSLEEHFPELCPKQFLEFPETHRYDSPHADMCDAFWMCEILRNHLKYEKLGPESIDPVSAKLLTSATSKKCVALVDSELIIKK